MFCVGDVTCPSLGIILFIVSAPIKENSIKTHVASLQIPLSLGLGTLDRHGWNNLTVQKQIKALKRIVNFLCIEILAMYCYNGQHIAL